MSSKLESPTVAREPTSGTERAVSEIWAEVLQLSVPPETTDDFFALGGDSMTMTMVEFRIKEVFSVELTPGTMLSAPSLGELAALVDTMSAPRPAAVTSSDLNTSTT
jgi:acyl carrier protein